MDMVDWSHKKKKKKLLLIHRRCDTYIHACTCFSASPNAFVYLLFFLFSVSRCSTLFTVSIYPSTGAAGSFFGIDLKLWFIALFLTIRAGDFFFVFFCLL